VYALKSNGLLMGSDDGRPGHYWSIDSGVKEVAVSPSGRVYALKTSGLFMGSDDGRPGYYSSIDSGVKEVAISRSGRVYALKTSGLLMASDVGYAPYFWTVATDVLSIAMNSDGTVGFISALQKASVPVLNTGRTAIAYRRQDVVINPYKWAEDGYKPEHIHQYNSGVCTIASALAAAAAAGLDLGSRIQYLGNSQYRVFLYEAGWQTVYFDGTVYDSDLIPRATGLSVQNGQQVTRLVDFWPLLFARAYLQYQAHVDWHSDPGSDSNWYHGFLGIRAPWTSPKNANFAVAGGDKNNWDTSEGSALGHLLDNLRLGSVCTVSTLDPAFGGQPNHSWNWIDRSIGTGHQWAVVGLTQGSDKVWRIQLYNPWGVDSDHGPLDGPDDGYVTMTWATFIAHFDTITMVTRAGVRY
jgi:hypothetical protein